MKTLVVLALVFGSVVAFLCGAPASVSACIVLGLTDTGEMFVSDDDGATWSAFSTLPVADAVAISGGETPAELFMATRSGVLYRSTDHGVSWTAIGAVAASDIVEMAIRTNGDIYLLSEKGSLWRSTDNGVTFDPHAVLTASNHVSLTGEGGGVNMYALTRTGEVARSTDFGATWTVVGIVTTSDAVAIRAVSLILYVLTGTGDVARSLDQGATWTMVGTISQVHMTGLTQNSTGLVAATKEGLIATSDDAVNWSFKGAINQLNVIAIGNDSPTITAIEDQPPAFSPLRVHRLWPNPARGDRSAIQVAFEIDTPGTVALELYDVAGRLVAKRDGRVAAGPGLNMVQWDTGELPSGVYFVQLVTESGLKARTKLTVVR